jgi:hypothetical protein
MRLALLQASCAKVRIDLFIVQFICTDEADLQSVESCPNSQSAIPVPRVEHLIQQVVYYIGVTLTMLRPFD